MAPAAIAIVLLLLFVVAPVVSFVLLVRAMGRANRISPHVPTIAPITWLVLPERPARLHRRLGRAVAMARAASAQHTRQAGRGIGTIPELVLDLERRACVIDSQLVVGSRTRGPARWSVLNELERQVYEVDNLSTRIVGMTAAWAASSAVPGRDGPAALSAIGDRLDALESAMLEVGVLGGGGHPSFMPAPTGPPPQPIPFLRRVEGDRD